MRVFDEAAEMQYLTINEKLSDIQKLEKCMLKIESKLSQSKHRSANIFSPGNVDTLCNVDIQNSYIEIDQAAELDSGASWKKINNRRMASHTSAGSEIKFRDKVCRDPAEIAAGWGQYFCELYFDLDRIHYDSNFQSYVERKVNSIFEELSSCEEGDVVYISAEEVRKSVKCLKTK